MFPTRNDLPESTRTAMIALLNERLADAIDLRLRAKHAHWNVKGPQFIALHELFDDLADAVAELSDDLAERAVQLGGVAHGLIGQVESGSKLPAYPTKAVSGHDHVEALADALAALAKATRAAIETAEQHGDAVTVDLFTQASGVLDKQLWLLEAHLHAKN
ncbi:Ferritin Dps family protein [Isosphaera pallida ATCC 43644]|uniref:Ferritin Dps family protein n=1 Tax=Isosphaera pallida (strain ATCC 43644 / DSM 9630 / IS1B) TaxID=575540 RepID=E8QZF1_ISOPI|nr:DNA starvation/stationary phase protection protein Dps [Isosphaera pallida]ADV61078.1 Ferritin Dps family protein [Isosphaera pallida ATCC 43644]